MSLTNSLTRSVCIRKAALAIAGLSTAAFAQTDPGPRPGTPAAGGPLTGLSAQQGALFLQTQGTFSEVDGVAEGLGPRFNADSCASCHAFPAVGGTSPRNNPQIKFANSRNSLPPFISANGPVREARFIRKPDGSPDGGVHALFTIDGRPDKPSGCSLMQESFSNASNISLRIPTPTFGLGLIEALPDSTLVANLAANSGAKLLLGISGRLNRNGNDGTVTRFGWKAQNKSLQIFAGEAYNVEQGVSNLLFPNERDETPQCYGTPAPNDAFHLASSGTMELMDDATQFAAFMRLLAPPARGPIDNSVMQGSNLFVNTGCANCHTPTLVTDSSPFGAAFSNQEIHPYSDFALHNMGSGLADQVSQGLAGGDEFRTAPLWGLGQRIFFLHDGRTSDLMHAIQAHASPGSEATIVTGIFNRLSDGDQQAILNFLRSL
jgi:CxxC motif-containing protein (DUF1111 family)